MTEINPGDRVQTHQWAPQVHTGTVTRVDTDADLRERAAEGDHDPTLYVCVRWDGTSFSEFQHHPDELTLVPGSGDDAAPYAVAAADEVPAHLGFGWTR